MTWLEFRNSVLVLLTVDGSRLGLSDYVLAMTRQAVIDIQSEIPLYRVGHETFYGIDDLVDDGKASRGELPNQAQIQEVYLSQDAYGYQCKRSPAYQYDWPNRYDLICGNMSTCERAIAIDPMAKVFLFYPRIKGGQEVQIVWNGLKLDFADTDVVPFDEQMAACVAYWVTGMIELRVNKDIAMAKTYADPVTKTGLYYSSRRRLYLDACDRKRIKQTTASPQSQTASPCVGCNTADSSTDDPIDFMMFGNFGSPGVNELAVSQLVKDMEPQFMIWLGNCNFPAGAADTIEAAIMDYYGSLVPQLVWPAWGPIDLSTTSGGQYGRPLLDIFPNISSLNSGKLYYDFIKGPIHFFVINSGYTNGDNREPDGLNSNEPQALWLQAALANSTSDWNVVLMNRSPYTSDVTETPGNTVLRWPFLPWGADLVVSAGGYNYERCLVDGLTYLIAGLGGATKRAFGTLTTGSQFRYTDAYGALRVTATSGRLQSVFYDTAGTVIDNFTLTKPGSL